ncbi:MAG: 3D domain-containing protein [Candidatus Moranbacteria bacterium]|nr:3D domain-containing protein [Candidatus Moranbacteria bacterium]
MRTISILLSVPMLWVMLFPQVALAAEADNTNIKIENKNNLENIKIPYNYPGYVPVQVKTQEDVKNDLALAKWKKKQTFLWDNLPKGKFTINASAYTAAADECGKSDGITSSGLKVAENRTLACPPNFPFGTKIQIDGMGVYNCEDRGGAIKGNHIDIYMQTKAEAFAFGRRNLIAQVVQ